MYSVTLKSAKNFKGNEDFCLMVAWLLLTSLSYRWTMWTNLMYNDIHVTCDFVNYVGDASPFHQKNLQQLVRSRCLADSLFRLFQDMWAGQHRRVKTDNFIVNKKTIYYI